MWLGFLFSFCCLLLDMITTVSLCGFLQSYSNQSSIQTGQTNTGNVVTVGFEMHGSCWFVVQIDAQLMNHTFLLESSLEPNSTQNMFHQLARATVFFLYLYKNVCTCCRLEGSCQDHSGPPCFRSAGMKVLKDSNGWWPTVATVFRQYVHLEILWPIQSLL